MKKVMNFLGKSNFFSEGFHFFKFELHIWEFVDPHPDKALPANSLCRKPCAAKTHQQ